MGCRFKTPKIGCQRSKLLAQFKGPVGIVDRRADLALVPNNARIEHQPLDIGLTKLRHPIHVKCSKGLAKGFTFVQDGQPAQARLKPFEADFLKKPAVIADRKSPFVVVVMLVGVSCTAPSAPANMALICKKSWRNANELHRRRFTRFTAHVCCPFVARARDVMTIGDASLASQAVNSNCLQA